MNKADHVFNAVGLSVGIAILLRPSLTIETFVEVFRLGVPIVIGTLIPDIDTAYGTHRQTLHNLPVLTVFMLFPIIFGNLQFVWIGILTHYVLDLLGNVGGMALFYPLPDKYDLPFGVPVNSRFATLVTIGVTGVELMAFQFLVERGIPIELARVFDAAVGV